MNKKEWIKQRYNVIEGNPTREERLLALLNNKIIKVKNYRTMFYKLDKYQRLCFSYTGHPSSFQPYQNGFDYYHVLDDYDVAGGMRRNMFEILDKVEGENK